MAQKSKHPALGEFLKKSRLKAGLSQAQVADSVKLSTPQCVSNWETGRTSPPMKHLKDICKMYSVNEGELFDLLVDYSIDQVERKMKIDFQRIQAAKSRSRK